MNSIPARSERAGINHFAAVAQLNCFGIRLNEATELLASQQLARSDQVPVDFFAVSHPKAFAPLQVPLGGSTLVDLGVERRRGEGWGQFHPACLKRARLGQAAPMPQRK
jgi:hypothetical protein